MTWFLRSLLAVWLLGVALAAPAQVFGGGKSVVTTERVRAELLAHAPEGVGPGKPVWLGLQLAHQPEWHTYWRNSGDSGLPTQLHWTLPPGVVAGEIGWPIPKKIPIGTLANYGYEGTVLLPVPLTITPDFKPSALASDLEVKLKAEWLVCRKECIPEEGEFTLKLPARGSTASHGPVFEAAFAAQPRPVLDVPAGMIPHSTAAIEDGALAIRVQGLPVPVRGKRLEFFPETPEVIETAAAWTQGWQGAVWTARVPLSAQRSASPAVLPVVVADGGQGWRAELRVAGTWPKTAAPATVSPELDAALRSNAAAAPPPSGPGIGLLAALAGALIGGLLLNLMPCVFPVLAIKVVGFAARSDDERGHRMAGIAYTAGVVLSFLALGALMLGLRAAGEQLGWGFQLQSPLVVAALAALFTLIALNLAGVFEFGAFLPSSVASMQVRNPAGNAFLSGMLAVAIASPCTAPFMGASLGLAIALPPAQALLVFGCLGVGMALPYLAASTVPAVARWLPKPGAWMDVFRKLMAFPMFATVAWLVWVLGQQSGVDGAGALLALLVALSLLVWTLTLRGRARTVLSALAVAGFAVLAWMAGPQLTQLPPQQAARAEGDWQPWTSSRVEQLVAAGQPVFVDFTAAWCVTCQYNKKTTLGNESLLADLKRRNVALLRADWTRRDPAITAALSALGRNGVPVYVYYKKGRAPVVLSEVLGVEEVRSVIAN
ncbi:MAG: Cytochrome c-type biogenesis protein DsbD, protein-disulfide reductase [uncultured Ramlibacter sp.]|uniref:Cytochrome c-type biogenesis protein DsbD, protein-disulfide reductase n=1 Tax=uncultured Ramlibacter sp. TaxID=260755 RepID=A0A6J4NHY9_9BURK|nr:MAG: Cytochrome c-type biogenesis protein DsbD, protein-disulfide reductase [uncultured Ramlibacter sp.]